MDQGYLAKAESLRILRADYHGPVDLPRLGVWLKSYQEYLISPNWISRKLAIFKKRGRRCESCGTRYRITVHHLSYSMIGQEPDDHLVILCWPCHQKRHVDPEVDQYDLMSAEDFLRGAS